MSRVPGTITLYSRHLLAFHSQLSKLTIPDKWCDLQYLTLPKLILNWVSFSRIAFANNADISMSCLARTLQNAIYGIFKLIASSHLTLLERRTSATGTIFLSSILYYMQRIEYIAPAGKKVAIVEWFESLLGNRFIPLGSLFGSPARSWSVSKTGTSSQYSENRAGDRNNFLDVSQVSHTALLVCSQNIALCANLQL